MLSASTAALDEGKPYGRLAKAALAAVVGLLVLATIALTYVTGGNVFAAIGPTLGAGLLWLIWKVPTRYTVLVLVFLGLTQECDQEGFGAGAFNTPWHYLGKMLLSKWNDWIPFKPLVLTGVDMIVGYLILIFVWRRATKSSAIDTRGQVRTAGVMALAAAITFGGALWTWLYGLARGGNFGNSLLQIYKILYVPLLFFVCQASLRGPKDHKALATVIVSATVYRALISLIIRKLIAPTMPFEVPYSTTHGDSMLFAGGFGILLAMLNEGVARKKRFSIALILLGMGVVIVGVVTNNRRVAWVEMGWIVFVYAAISTWTPLKRGIARGIIVGFPIVCIYMAIGWNSSGTGIFKPVRIARSVLDSKSDTSTLWRDLENADLILNIQQNPILGTGLGHEYNEVIKLPDVSAAFKLYRYIPHNSILGFIAFAGVLGFSTLWAGIAIGIFLAARAYRTSQVPLDRAMALWSIATCVCYMVSVYGDMGQGSWTAVFTVCPALAVAGKLAVASGAWPAPVRRRGALAMVTP